MAEFKYTVKNQEGRTLNGSLNVTTEEAAVNALRDKKYIIISLHKKKNSNFFFNLTSSLFAVRVKADELAIFSRQLTTMVNAGLPLVQSLDILKEQSDKKSFRNIIEKVKESVEGGSSLSEALSKYPKTFSELFINMISAGEVSGMLDEILLRMAAYLEETSNLQKKIKSAMVYPAAIMLTAVGISIFMLLKVVPAFEEIYSSLGGELPGPTRFLIDLSNVLKQKLLLVVAAFVILGFTGYAFFKTEKGRIFIDRLVLNLPVVGKLVKKVSISRFSRTLSTLTKSGVSILTSLNIVAKTSGNKILEEVIIKSSESVRSGETIAQPLSKSGIFPPLVIRMIAVGEQTGSLDEMLTKVADFYDTEVTAAVEGLTSLIEPLVIVFLGVIIGGIVVALYLPIFNLAELVG